MVMTESLLIFGPLSTNELVVVELVVLEVVELVVGTWLVVAVVSRAVVVVSPAPLLPQAAATRARTSPRKVMRFMGRQDKSGCALGDAFRRNGH